MRYSTHEMLATATEIFLGIISDPLLTDKATLEREVFRLSNLSALMSIGQGDACISLRGARILGAVSAEGYISTSSKYAVQYGLTFDRDRLDMDGLHDGSKINDVQKVIIDSVAFSTALRLQHSFPYNLILANLIEIEAADCGLFERLNDELIRSFRQVMLDHILDYISFDEGDVISRNSIIAIQVLIESFRKSTDGVIEIDESMLRNPSYTKKKMIISDELLLNNQYGWLKIFAREAPDKSSERRERDEYDATIELLTIRHQLLRITLEEKWESSVTDSVLALLSLSLPSDYNSIPRSIVHVLAIIDEAMAESNPPPDHFSRTLAKITQMIREYSPGFFSCAASIKFFEDHQERMRLKEDDRASLYHSVAADGKTVASPVQGEGSAVSAAIPAAGADPYDELPYSFALVEFRNPEEPDEEVRWVTLSADIDQVLAYGRSPDESIRNVLFNVFLLIDTCPELVPLVSTPASKQEQSRRVQEILVIFKETYKYEIIQVVGIPLKLSRKRII